MKPEIVLAGPMYPGTMRQLDETFTVHRLFDVPDRDAVLAKARDSVTAVATSGGTGAKAELMDALPNLKIISCFAVGVDAVDLEAAKARGIAVTNTPDVLTDDVADLAIALMLASARLVVAGDRYVRDGKWLEGNMRLGRKVGGSTVGVVGLGRIGRGIAERAQAFGATVVWHGPRPKPEAPWRYYGNLVEMARAVDFLIVASPGGAATKHLVDRAVLEALGRDGTLVNIARGSVVDEAALLDALQSKKLGAAALDVFADEPRVPEAFFAMENVVLQPHQASATHATRAAMGQLVVDNLKAFFAGKPLLTRVV